MEIKNHWNLVFENKTDEQKSWFQPIPETSLRFMNEFALPKEASIIDVGGGDSRLADVLLAQGFTNITVLDISSKALENAQRRLGINAQKITWIESNILDFTPSIQYDCWHDRAVFHFVTDKKEINAYKILMAGALKNNGKLIIGTFSEKGPEMCSGLRVQRYSQSKLSEALSEDFRKIKCMEEIHHTPFQTTQSFTFCSFSRKESVN